jgi:hypothetical protein
MSFCRCSSVKYCRYGRRSLNTPLDNLFYLRRARFSTKRAFFYAAPFVGSDEGTRSSNHQPPRSLNYPSDPAAAWAALSPGPGSCVYRTVIRQPRASYPASHPREGVALRRSSKPGRPPIEQRVGELMRAICLLRHVEEPSLGTPVIARLSSPSAPVMPSFTT